MQLKGRLRKLEQSRGRDGFAAPPKFISFGDELPGWAVLPGHDGDLRKLGCETHAEFFQRVYRIFVDASGLQCKHASDLSDGDLKALIASSSAHLAFRYQVQGTLTNDDLANVLGDLNREQMGTCDATKQPVEKA